MLKGFTISIFSTHWKFGGVLAKILQNLNVGHAFDQIFVLLAWEFHGMGQSRVAMVRKECPMDKHGSFPRVLHQQTEDFY